MATKQSISEFRNVKIELSDALGQDIVDQTAQIAAPVDAYKAALEVVAELEGKYAKLGASGAPDLTGATVLKSGAIAHQIHVFTVTTVMADAEYVFIYVETVPTSDDVS
jgi:hypothetical protein